MIEIPFSQKVHIGLVKQCQYIISTLITTSLLIFYTDFIGIREITLFGIAMLFFGFWNAINDPLFGYYSDIRVSKGKLRKPLIKLGMPIMLSGFFMIILVPQGWADWNIFLILLMGLIIFDLGKALSMVNYDAFTITLADNADERSKLNLVISYIGIVPGALIGIIPAYFLTGDFTYVEVLLLFLILVLSFFFISYFSLTRMHEPPEIYYRGNSDGSSIESENLNSFTLKEGFSQTLRSKAFLILIIFRFVAFFFHGLYYTNIIYMMKWVVPTKGLMTLLLAGAGGLIINVMYPILIKVRKKIGTTPTIQLFLIAGIPGYIIMFFASDLLTLTIGYVISTLSFSGLFFEGVLIGDICDEDFVNTGNRKQGIFISIYGFFTTISYSIMILLYTIALDYFQYDGSLIEQSSFTIMGLRLLTTFLPISAIIICFLILKYYPLKGEHYNQLRAKIEELQASSKEFKNLDL